MTKKSIFNMIFSIVFIGVILSFALYFILTLVMRPEYNIEDEYFGGATVGRTIFSEYDDACLKNGMFYDLIVKTEYTVFGNVVNGKVIKGDGGFLFASGSNEYGYDYIADYRGEVDMDEETLDKVYQYIEMRRLAYENQGRYYLMAVIPNSQTVYSEYMPTAYGEISDSTVLASVGKYLDEKGFENFLDLTPYMREAKADGLVYNNTENSINALGAYYIYHALVERLEADGVSSNKPLDRSFFDLYTHHTDGKTTAELAGISSIVQNETISMSNATEYMYTTVELFKDLETTYTKSEYSDRIPIKPSVLLELTGEWDKIQLMPYFSNTFGMASYRVSHMYSRAALDNSNPYIVIQLIHEDELMSILKGDISKSYSDGLNLGQDPYKTAKPRVLSYVMPDEYTVCVTGEVEKGSTVSLFGDDFKAITVNELEERFIAIVKFDETAVGKEIFIRAKTEGKTVSDHVNILLEDEDISKNAPGGVLVGNNSVIYRENYNVPGIPDREVLDRFANGVSGDMDRYLTHAGDGVSVIYGIIPEKLSVYCTGAHESLADQISDYETLRSLVRVELMSCGVDTIDFSKVLRENLAAGKMFNQSNDLLTDLAYYFIYSDIIENVNNRFPAAVPYERDHYVWQTYKLSSGSLARALGFSIGEMVEKSNGAIIKNTASLIQGSGGIVDKSKAYVTHNYVNGLPSAIIVRDNSGTRAADFLADHFSTMYVMDEGVYDIPDEVLQKVDPDYIIYLFSESNIETLIEG